ncbi:MAG: tetratricopeptide repeat protein [Candidatus Omnitrophica bacterium]|nr:tetratricopeptide repeat protein [Candidatus Omnitrophota bacterium]
MIEEQRRGRGITRPVSILLILLVGLAAYHNSFSAPFLFDDLGNIVDNPHLRHLGSLPDVLFGASGIGVAGRPVANLSFALNYALNHLDVYGYHVVNLAIHLVAACVLFGIVRRTLQSARLTARYGRDAPGLALAAALLWTAHPLLTESVVYLTQRTELLLGLFMLLTLYSVIRGAASRDGRGWYAAAVAFCALGMGSKEGMVVAPLITLLYDRIFLASSFQEIVRRRRGLYAGLALTWLIFVSLAAGYHRGETADLLLGTRNSLEYVLTQCAVIIQYLRLAVWPHPLVFDYGDWPIAETLTAVLPQVLAVAGLLAATCWALRRRPALGFLGAWFFLLLAPTSSVFPILTEIAAERRMYLALSAVIVLVVLAGWHGLRQLRATDRMRGDLAAVLTAALTGGLIWATVQRNAAYASPISIWSDAVGKRPQNARAHNYLGAALADQGRFEEAIVHYQEAIRLKPGHAFAHNNLGLVLFQLGRVPEALAHYDAALRINPGYAEAHNNLGVSLVQQGKLLEAIAHYEVALRLRPDSPRIKDNLRQALGRLTLDVR